jgi:hypothetical protein
MDTCMFSGPTEAREAATVTFTFVGKRRIASAALPEKTVRCSVFKEYHPYQTKTGFHLGTWKEAMEFNNYHEGIHLGIMMSIKKHI